jgi:hypothetical protein
MKVDGGQKAENKKRSEDEELQCLPAPGVVMVHKHITSL